MLPESDGRNVDAILHDFPLPLPAWQQRKAFATCRTPW